MIRVGLISITRIRRALIRVVLVSVTRIWVALIRVALIRIALIVTIALIGRWCLGVGIRCHQ